MLQPSGYMTVSSYDNVKPLKTVATAIRRWGGGNGPKSNGVTDQKRNFRYSVRYPKQKVTVRYVVT